MNPLTRVARPAARFLAPAALALSLMSAALPTAQPAAAAGLPDLDVTKCTLTPYVWYGESWYAFRIEVTNEGTAAAGPFRYAAQPVFNAQAANNLFFGLVGDEVRVERIHPGLAAGQKASLYFDVTKKVFDQRTWGIFLDIQHQVAESQENDNFCSYYVNNS
jgi:hypothetical protein